MTTVLESWVCLLGENEHCTPGDPCFTCADAAHRARAAAGECPDDCLECKTASIVVGAQVGIDSRGRKFGELGFKDTNSWERGVPTDSKGMPFIDTVDGHVIGQKEASERHREIDATMRRNHHAATAASTTGSN